MTPSVRETPKGPHWDCKGEGGENLTRHEFAQPAAGNEVALKLRRLATFPPARCRQFVAQRF